MITQDRRSTTLDDSSDHIASAQKGTGRWPHPECGLGCGLNCYVVEDDGGDGARRSRVQAKRPTFQQSSGDHEAVDALLVHVKDRMGCTRHDQPLAASDYAEHPPNQSALRALPQVLSVIC